MKKLLVMLLCLTMALSLVACGDNGDGKESNPPAGSDGTNPPETQGAQNPPASGDTISLTMWGAEEDQTLLTELIADFKAAYPDQKFDIQLGVESEATAKDTILTDPQAAADVYAFASDQLPALADAGAILDLSTVEPALQSLAGKTIADIQAANTQAYNDLATYNGKYYAFPSVADGWFMFYDGNVLSEDDVKDWDTMVKACEAAGKKVGFTFCSGWYNACLFYGAGFNTTLNADGTTSCDFNGTSSKGVKGVDVVKYMQNLASSSAMMALPEGGTSAAFTGGECAVIFSGCWDSNAAQEAWGDNYAAAPLPSFTINGTSYAAAPVKSCKMVGVNPFSKQTGWATLLAEFITNQQSQVKRFEQRAAAPTNIEAAKDPAVAVNKGVAALNAQASTAIIQSVGGNYWSPTASFGEQIAQGTIGSDDAAIQTALDDMVTGVTAPVA